MKNYYQSAFVKYRHHLKAVKPPPPPPLSSTAKHLIEIIKNLILILIGPLLILILALFHYYNIVSICLGLSLFTLILIHIDPFEYLGNFII